MEKEKLYSKKLDTSTRTYFFDLKRTREGYIYLLITEKKDGKRRTLMVFEENLNDFISALQDVASRVKGG